MDSEKTARHLTSKKNQNASLFSESKTKLLTETDQNHGELNKQLVTENTEEWIIKSSYYPLDPWDEETNDLEKKIFSNINELIDTPVNDTNEFKKNLSNLYKEIHDLMTHYNQRIHTLVMDDRFLYRHSSQVTALMIRDLMPSLENIKLLEKSLTSTRKNTEPLTEENILKTSEEEFKKIMSVLKEAREKIKKHTKPLKPEQILQYHLNKTLNQEANILRQQINNPNSSLHQKKTLNNTEFPINTLHSDIAAVDTLSYDNSINNLTVDDLNSKQLKVLATKLENENQEINKKTIQSITEYVESEYRHYTSIIPLLSVANQKCELLSMNGDKTCKACMDAIDTIKKYSNFQENNLSNKSLFLIDQAITKLRSFDKKIPGEVWQLLTELTVDHLDDKNHLLNLLCRKILLDGSSLLTQKSSLSKFKDVLELMQKVNDIESDYFDQTFINTYGWIFTSTNSLKKTLNIVNKPHEVNAILKMLFRHKLDDKKRIIEEIERVRITDNNKHLNILISGMDSFTDLIVKIPEQLDSEIKNFRSFEKNKVYNKHNQNILEKYSAYQNALEFINTHQHDIESKLTMPQYDYKDSLFICKKKLTKILDSSDQRQNNLLNKLDSEITRLINHSKSDHHSKSSNALFTTVVESLKMAFLTDGQASLLIRLFIETLTDITYPSTAIRDTNNFEPSEDIVETISFIENGTSAKWYNQSFTSHVQEQRINTVSMINNIFNACQQTTANPHRVSELIQVTVTELTTSSEDPLIKRLGSELLMYADKLK